MLDFGEAVALQLSEQGLGDSLFLNNEDGDALDAVLDMSLKEVLGGTESDGDRCEVVLILSDFALASMGFVVEPGNGWALLPWMDVPEVDMVRDETDRPALDNDGR